MSDENKTSQGVKDWLRDLSTNLDTVKETAIRTEAKLEAYSSRTGDNEALLKTHDMQIGDLEKKVSHMQGGMRMLQWVGGFIGGLVLIGQLAVMIIKG